MGRSGNNPSGHSLICFAGQSPQLRGLCINEPTSASMHNRPLPQGSIFLHLRNDLRLHKPVTDWLETAGNVTPQYIRTEYVREIPIGHNWNGKK